MTSKDKIVVKGIVEITNGKTHRLCHNKATSNLLRTLSNLIASDSFSTVYAQYYIGLPSYPFSSAGNSRAFITLGSNTTTATTEGLQALVSPIGASPGSKPGAQSFSTSNPSNGVYRVIYTGIWDAGTVSGTVGELGLYLLGWPAPIKGAGWAPYNGSTTYDPISDTTGNAALLMNRLCTADNEFQAFNIDTSNALTVSWTLQMSFS